MAAAPHESNLEFTVNGEPPPFPLRLTNLLEVLREDLNLTGTKHVLRARRMRACAVLVDGERSSPPGARRGLRGQAIETWRDLPTARHFIRCRRPSPTWARAVRLCTPGIS